jgi:hypothetical protein
MPLPAQFMAAKRKPATPPTTNPSITNAKEDMLALHYIHAIVTLWRPNCDTSWADVLWRAAPSPTLPAVAIPFSAKTAIEVSRKDFM